MSARQLDGLGQILLGIEDITERKKCTEATLHESEERIRLMADTAPVMIWVSGLDKARTFFNTGWLAFTGRSPLVLSRPQKGSHPGAAKPKRSVANPRLGLALGALGKRVTVAPLNWPQAWRASVT